jgi:Zn-dependent protease with chaperone function
MLRINGLFGWVSHNDRRSATLFLGFVLVFHLLAAVGLFVPLAIEDLAHAPVYNWTGYAMRYVPLATAAGALLFLVQFWWHVNTIRGQSGFRYTYKGEEPRLCRIVEPLVIAAGLPEPRLAVIESPALNAFACGLSQKGAVLVVTRGLIDGLDDDELAAVIAHELVHIRNGDVRLMAAANVCLRSIALLSNQGSWKEYREALALPIALLAMPILFVVLLAVSFMRQSAIHLGHLTRLLISSAREFVADAEAVRLTQNPAALVSALEKIEGRSHVTNLPPEQDAMMIDGPTKGAMATHPSIAERIAALARVTGSMAVIAPARRDTRPGRTDASPAFDRSSAGLVTDLRQSLIATQTARSATMRVAVQPERNMLGLTREMSIATMAGIAAFLFLHRADLTNPQKLAAQFDIREFAFVMEAAGQTGRCAYQGLGAFMGLTDKPAECSGADIAKKIAIYKGEGSYIGKIFSEMARGFTSVTPMLERSRMVRSQRCIAINDYSVGDRGLFHVNETRGGRGSQSEISMSRYLGDMADSVKDVNSAKPENRDLMLKSYVKRREAMIAVVHRFFGQPGLDMAQSAYATPEHSAVVSTIRERLADPEYSASLSPLELAEYELLTSAPDQFITCVARKSLPSG